jgi:hypothetical protein
MSDDMSDEEKEFLKENFKQGEYSALTILVNNKQLEKFMEVLKTSGLNLAVMPHVKGAVDPEENGPLQ